jgi:hypothetical protein
MGMAMVSLLSHRKEHRQRKRLTINAASQISIVQNLTYFEHLSEPMAEFLHILSEQYDYPQLADEILRELSNKEFNSNDTKGPKSVSTFIIRLSELAPRLVIKQVTMLAKQLDSEVSKHRRRSLEGVPKCISNPSYCSPIPCDARLSRFSAI